MKELKAFNVRIPKELWSFLKKDALDKEISLNVLINLCLKKYRELHLKNKNY